MSEVEDLARSFANLKGSKDKDLIGTAESLARLKRRLGSNERVGKAVGVSREIVREFLTLLSFPPEIQELFRQRVLGLEHGRLLWQLAQRRPDLLEDVAVEMKGMTAHDAREMVSQLLRNPQLKPDEVKERVLGSKTITRREFHVIALLDEQSFAKIARAARTRGISVDQLVTSLVEDWLAAQD